MANNDKIWFSKALLRSSAFRSLSKWSLLVYFDFLRKRQMSLIPHKEKKIYIIKNNGDIEYSFIEAERKGIGRREFNKALNELIEKGFIDVDRLGKGGRMKIDKRGQIVGDMTTYFIADRWKDYGKHTFKAPKIERKKDTRKGIGWASIWADPIKKKEMLEKRAKALRKKKQKNISIVSDTAKQG
jgi:hypothetical protein